MSSSRAMQRLCGLMRKAVQDYEMIAPGDKVMVGVSGGKDSVALTIGLAELRKYIGFDFTVQAVTLDPQFGGKPMDYTVLQELFARYDIPYEIRRTEIGPVVFDYRKEKNPCALCAKLRRGALHTAAQELGCNKVALGHHLDDAVETFYMNLWREGRIGCFSPVTYLSRRDLTLIRPMLLATEQEVISAVHAEGLPIVKSVCPADGVTVREQTKEFVKERCRTDHAFRQKTLHALQESRLDELGSLEAAEHLTFCDYCLARYTALIESAPEKLKQPMRDLIPQVQALMRLRSFRIMTNRYVSTAAAVMLAFALWRFGFFGGVGTVQKSVQQLPDVTPRVTVSQALGGMFDSMSSGLSNMFDGMQLTINSGLAQLADPVVPRSNPTNNGGSPAHGE